MKGKIAIVNKRGILEQQLLNSDNYCFIDCTSKSIDKELANDLSPFYLGPVDCYDGLTSKNMENAWQYAKVYEGMVDEQNNPTELYFSWRNNGFASNKANRHPVGRSSKPLYSYWKVNDKYCKLDYIQARKLIYIPCYAKAVVKTASYKRLQGYLENGINLALADYDGYNYDSYNMNLKQVVNNPNKIMGHSFVLALLLENLILVENGEVIYSEELKAMKE